MCPAHILKDHVITKALKERLGLEDVSSERWTLSKSLSPVLDVDKLLTKARAQKTSAAATDRTDTYTVPLGKRWRVSILTMSRANAGTMKFYANINNVTDIMIDQSSSSDTQLTAQISTEIILEKNDFIEAVFSAGTSGTLNSHIIYMEETIL